VKNVFEHLRDMGTEAPRLYINATGAGAGLQNIIWSVPGISNFFVGARMPYDTEETAELLGFTPDKFVSADTAIDLAMTAYMKAWAPGRKAVGLGLTCSVASTREHRGDHRVIAAVFGDDSCWVASVVIPKGVGAEQRHKDGELSDHIAQELLAFFVGPNPGCLDFLAPGCEITLCEASDLARKRLFAHPLFWADGTRAPVSELDPTKAIIFAANLNPPHPGHFGAAEASAQVVARKMGQARKVVFATTATHPTKPALTTAECLQRARLMKGRSLLITEGDGLYIEKARKFPGAVFAMGADAALRLVDPQWGPVKEHLAEFKRLGTRFMVSHRMVGDRLLKCGRLLHDNWDVVGGSTHLFEEVDFHLDISSTQLREQAAK